MSFSLIKTDLINRKNVIQITSFTLKLFNGMYKQFSKRHYYVDIQVLCLLENIKYLDKWKGRHA